MAESRQTDNAGEDKYLRGLQSRFSGYLHRWFYLVFALALGIVIYYWAEELYSLFVLLTFLVSIVLLWISLTGYTENISEIWNYSGKYSFYVYDMLGMVTLQLTVFIVVRRLSSLYNIFDKADVSWGVILAVALISVSISFTRQIWRHSIFLFYRSDLADDIKKAWKWVEKLTEKRRRYVALSGIMFAWIDIQSPQRLADIFPELLVAVTLFVSIVVVHICLNPERERLGISRLLERICWLMTTAVASIGLMGLYLALSTSRPFGEYISEIEIGGSLEQAGSVLYAMPRALQVLAAFAIGAGVAIILISFTRMCDWSIENGNTTCNEVQPQDE